MSATPFVPVDHGDRDRRVAVSSYTTVLRRAAVPDDRFRAYWRDVHGPLCSRVPGLDWYVQHHFARQRDSHGWPLPDGVTTLPDYVLDGAVEIGWASQDRQAEFQDASAILFADEQNVFEETVAYELPTGSVTVVDRVPDPVPNGRETRDRSHVHLQPRPGQAAALSAFLLDDFATVARDSPDVVTLRVHTPEPHDNSTPSPPAPHVRHEVPAARVTLAILEVSFEDALARRRFHASRPFEQLQGRFGELAETINVFPVSGVFTFVRDGALTTAGLRGSRVAELITDLAAANQVADDVRHLMHTGTPE